MLLCPKHSLLTIQNCNIIEYEGCKRGQRKGTSQQQQASGEEAAADLEQELGAADWEGGGGKRQKRTMMFSGRRVGQL